MLFDLVVVMKLFRSVLIIIIDKFLDDVKLRCIIFNEPI